jgi:hypothetical protein
MNKIVKIIFKIILAEIVIEKVNQEEWESIEVLLKRIDKKNNAITSLEKYKIKNL